MRVHRIRLILYFMYKEQDWLPEPKRTVLKFHIIVVHAGLVPVLWVGSRWTVGDME